MAKTLEQITEAMLGNAMLRIAVLTAQLEKVTEERDALKAAPMTPPERPDTPRLRAAEKGA